MSDENVNYYQPSLGSLVGFDQIDTATGTPNIAVTGWSIEELRRFLLNQTDVNFPSAEFILRVQQLITAHENDFNNPHHTTLDQIVGDFVAQALGSITVGTVPAFPPFYSIDAQLGLPLGSLVPVTYSSSNLYRQSAGGWLVDTATDSQKIGTDYTLGTPGIPLFSEMTNIGLSGWNTATGALLGTSTSVLSAASLNYPFTFQLLSENPVTSQFGINLKMTQTLATGYTTSCFIHPNTATGFVRLYQPSDAANYVTVNLATGASVVTGTAMAAKTIKLPDGVIRVWVSFKSSDSVVDNMLRVVHLDTNQSNDGTRAGSFGRTLFAIAQPQTTESNLGHPTVVNLATDTTISELRLLLDRVGTPAVLPTMTLTMSLNMYPELSTAAVNDGTILLFDDLVITRDQTTIRVSVAGNPQFTSVILPGLNIISLSYSPTKLIFKDLASPRQEVSGTFPTLATNSVVVGPFGGYLRNLALYAQADTTQVVEFLTNG